MRWGQQYPATKFELTVLRLLIKHRGLSPTEFARLYWPHLTNKPGLLAALILRRLVKKKLIRIRFSPHPCQKHPYSDKRIPRKRYFPTDEGFATHDYHRKLAFKNCDASHDDRAG